jgi:hypothetical protein
MAMLALRPPSLSSVVAAVFLLSLHIFAAPILVTAFTVPDIGTAMGMDIEDGLVHRGSREKHPLRFVRMSR